MYEKIISSLTVQFILEHMNNIDENNPLSKTMHSKSSIIEFELKIKNDKYHTL